MKGSNRLLAMGNFLTKRREPFKFMLVVGIASIVLLFLGLSFIYVLRKHSPDWVNFKLPGLFWVSTLVILLSSLTLNRANAALRNEDFTSYKWLTGSTLVLGVAFIVTQFLGWKQLLAQGVAMVGSPSGAFLYIISGLHVLHILGGIIFLAIAFVNAVKRTTYVESFVYTINPPTQLRLTLVSVYWHFVDGLWLYLFLFFLYHHW